VQLRPVEEWISVPVPAIIPTELFALVQARLGRNRAWARRNTRHDYLLRRLVSCARCGLAHHVWTNGRYAYYRCRGADTLLNRLRPEPCRARQLPAAELDAVVWADICRVISEPDALEEALHRAQRGWLSDDEQTARHRDVLQRQHDVQRQIERLIDAYTTGILSREELSTRRRKLEERLVTLRREEQQATAGALRDEHLQDVAASLERFRAHIAHGLEQADFATRRAIVELLVDRVVVDAPTVEVRYVIPFTGLAQRKGVLRPHYRTRPSGHQGTLSPDARLRQLPLGSTLLFGSR